MMDLYFIWIYLIYGVFLFCLGNGGWFYVVVRLSWDWEVGGVSVYFEDGNVRF